MKETEGRAIEGTRLALLTPQESLVSRILLKYIERFLKTKVFDATMAPFLDRLVCPSWLRNKFLGSSPSTAAMSNAVWVTFLTLTILSSRVEVGTPGYGFAGYQPNLLTRQLGCSQFQLSSLYVWEEDICWSERKFNHEEFKACIKFARSQVLKLSTFAFFLSFNITVEFHNWWMGYLACCFSEEDFLARISYAPSTVPKIQEQQENQKCKARIRFLEGVTNGLWLLFGNDGEQNAMVGKARLVCYVWTEKWGIKWFFGVWPSEVQMQVAKGDLGRVYGLSNGQGWTENVFLIENIKCQQQGSSSFDLSRTNFNMPKKSAKWPSDFLCLLLGCWDRLLEEWPGEIFLGNEWKVFFVC
ncbi:hypothetical protein KIW84_011145 [Lathyrus oleraceus]|uniref:Uncharacterized protein n=1 Tax=Pisum sativum TaxID=3888 RepID=A0A9D5BC78_PEA|nr:hypothetical protein KIW84_011145 [Pisum sativum]